MSDNKNNKQFGQPWKKAATFSNFEDADIKRNKLLKNKHLQAKVRHYHNASNYVVLYRELVSAQASKNKKAKKSTTK